MRRASTARVAPPALRARLLPLLAVAGGACGDPAPRGVAATVDDWTLTGERLAELLVDFQPLPLDSAFVFELTGQWVSVAALALRSAAGDSLLGATALEAGVWLDRREAALAAEREVRLAESVAVSEAEAEAVFAEGRLRLVAHLLKRAGPGTPSSARLGQRREAERILEALIEGGSWSDAVAQSDDRETRGAGGLLGLFASGELPSALDRVVENLEPGRVSSVVQSGEGFHIVHRPRFEDARSPYRRLLRERRLAEADARSNEDEREAREFAVLPRAAARVGELAGDPSAWLGSPGALARWEGGELPDSIAARYLLHLPAQSLVELATAGEAAHTDLIVELGTREMRLIDAAAGGDPVPVSTGESLRRLHADEIEYWTEALALDPGGAASREALASYIESFVAGEEGARSLPPLLEAWLLGRVEHRVHPRGVMAAIVAARNALAGVGADPGESPRGLGAR